MTDPTSDIGRVVTAVDDGSDDRTCLAISILEGPLTHMIVETELFAGHHDCAIHFFCDSLDVDDPVLVLLVAAA